MADPSFSATATIQDEYTPVIMRMRQGVEGLEASTKKLDSTQAEYNQNLRAHAAGIEATTDALREANLAEEDAKVKKRGTLDATQQLNKAMRNRSSALRHKRKHFRIQSSSCNLPNSGRFAKRSTR